MDTPPTKLEILSFIRDQEVVWIETLCAYYGYTYWGGVSRLKRLRKGRLVEPLYRRGQNQGRYVLTTRGFERLEYLTETEKSKQQGEQASRLREDELEDEVRRLSRKVRELVETGLYLVRPLRPLWGRISFTLGNPPVRRHHE